MPPFRGGGKGVYHPTAFSSPDTAREDWLRRLSLGSMSPTRLFSIVASGQNPASVSPREVIVAAPPANGEDPVCRRRSCRCLRAFSDSRFHDREPRGSRLVVPLAASIGPVASS
jgi:hypothetical protein